MRFDWRLGCILILGLSAFVLSGLSQTYSEVLKIFRESPRSEESLQAAVQIRQKETGEDSTTAQLAVLHDIADIEAAEERWRDAGGHSIAALEIARCLEDADLILDHGLRTAHFAFMSGARG